MTEQRVSGQVASQTRDLPFFHGIIVTLFGRLAVCHLTGPSQKAPVNAVCVLIVESLTLSTVAE